MTLVKDFIQNYRKPCALAALLLALSLLAAVNYPWSKEPEAPKDSAAISEPEVAAKSTGISRTGLVGTPALVPISAGFSGRISELYVKEGQSVKAGQPLFKLDPAPGSSAAAAPSSDLKSNSQTVEYSRYLKLYEQGVISRRELEAAEARLKGINKSAPGGQSAGTAPVPTTATAPVEGVVTGLATASGSAVQADQLILSLGSGQIVEVVVPLEQKELYWVQLGTPVIVEVAGQTIAGEVSSIFPEVGENNLVSFLAHIHLINPPAGLVLAGMSANVLIDVGP